MAIGRAYPQDNKIVDADLFLGTKSSSLATVNYTAQSVADYLNNQGKISIGGQTTFKFVVVNPVVGTISFPNGGGDNTDFSLVTNLIVSIIDMSNQNVVDFIDYIIGSEILLTEQNQVSIFGNYKIITYSVTSNPNFYDLSLEYIGGYGSLHKDLYYDLSFFRDSIVPPPAPIPSLNEVLSVGNTSLLDAKIGELYLYDTSNQDYGKIQLSDSEYNFYNTSGDIISTISNVGAIFRASLYYGFLNVPTTLTANRTYEFPNASGTIALTSDLTPYLLSTTAASTYYPIPTGTISQYIRGDGTFATFPTIPTIGTWGTLNYPAWTTGTPFVKMTAVGTFALDTNTYLTGITSSDVTTALGYTPANASGTTNYLPKFTGTSALGNSLISESTNLININSASVLLDNNRFLRGKFVDGTVKDIIGIDIANEIVIGNVSAFHFTNIPNIYIDGTAVPTFNLSNSAGALGQLILESGATGNINIRGNGGTRLMILSQNGQMAVAKGNVSLLAQQTIYPYATTIKGQVIKGFTGQTANLQEWQDSIGTVLAAVTAAGNVGIGTTAPAEKLTINATANSNVNAITIYSNNNVAQAYTSIGSYYASGNTNVNSQIRFGNEVTTGGASYLALATGTSTTATEKMRITSTGNVGIGTTAPAAKLQVNAPGALSTDIAFKIRNSADTRNFLVVNGAGDVYNNGAGGINTSTIFGENSGRNSSGGNNTFFGNAAGFSATSGGSNTAIGSNSLASNTTGTTNTAIGVFTLLNVIGNNNIGIGFNAGRYIADGATSLTTSSESIFIGNVSRPNSNGESNQIVIGYNATGLGSNTVVLGNSSILTTALRGNIGIGTTAPTAKLQVNAPGALSTDLAFKIRNSADTLDLVTVDGLGTLIGKGFQGTYFYAGTTYYDNARIYIGSTSNAKFQTFTSGFSIEQGALTTIAPTAIFELKSTTQGFLPPRMTNAQRIAIATPAVGLCVYCTDVVEGLYINKSTGWTYIG